MMQEDCLGKSHGIFGFVHLSERLSVCEKIPFPSISKHRCLHLNQNHEESQSCANVQFVKLSLHDLSEGLRREDTKKGTGLFHS